MRAAHVNERIAKRALEFWTHADALLPRATHWGIPGEGQKNG
jgi:hypothetical protein